MILDTLDVAGRYVAVHPALAAGFAFLANPDLASLAPGRYEIDGANVYALVSHDAGRGEAGARLEFHRRYIDIQVSLDGRERIGWRALAACQQVSEPYDEKRDVGFHADRPDAWFPVERGQFAIFFPDDAHAPLAGTGPLHKVVIKVAVDAI